MTANQFPIRKRASLPGHFPEPVLLEAVRQIGSSYKCRVRLIDGTPHEAIISPDEAATLFGRQEPITTKIRPADAEKTKRFQLVEKLTAQADHLLLLTATPHRSDDDRFAHFVRLLDPDVFPEPHRVGEKAGDIRREIPHLGPDCPRAIRRLKEDLSDLDGGRLFSDRHAHTRTFRLNREEYELYKAVTAYINEFLPQASGHKKQSVALARTVLQRRPAQLQGRLADAKQDEDDLDDAARDRLVGEFTETTHGM